MTRCSVRPSSTSPTTTSGWPRPRARPRWRRSSGSTTVSTRLTMASRARRSPASPWSWARRWWGGKAGSPAGVRIRGPCTAGRMCGSSRTRPRWGSSRSSRTPRPITGGTRWATATSRCRGTGSCSTAMWRWSPKTPAACCTPWAGTRCPTSRSTRTSTRSRCPPTASWDSSTTGRSLTRRSPAGRHGPVQPSLVRRSPGRLKHGPGPRRRIVPRSTGALALAPAGWRPSRERRRAARPRPVPARPRRLPHTVPRTRPSPAWSPRPGRDRRLPRRRPRPRRRRRQPAMSAGGATNAQAASGTAAIPGLVAADHLPGKSGSAYRRHHPSPLHKPPSETRAQQAFIDAVAPGAIAAQHRYGVPAAVTIAQAIDESGWGQSQLAAQDHNLFGIKGTGPAGSVPLPTQEYVNGQQVSTSASFRVYHDVAESIDDHGRLLADSGYYQQAMADRQHPNEFAKALTGVYATDPNYGSNLISLMLRYDLYRYGTAGQAQLAHGPAGPAPGSATIPGVGGAPSAAPGPTRSAGLPPARGRPGHTSPSRPGQPARSRSGRPARNRPGRPARSRLERPPPSRPGRPARSRPGRLARSRPGRPIRSRPGRPARSRPGRPTRSRPGPPARSRPGPPARSPAGPPARSPLARPSRSQGGRPALRRRHRHDGVQRTAATPSAPPAQPDIPGVTTQSASDTATTSAVRFGPAAPFVPVAESESESPMTSAVRFGPEAPFVPVDWSAAARPRGVPPRGCPPRARAPRTPGPPGTGTPQGRRAPVWPGPGPRHPGQRPAVPAADSPVGAQLVRGDGQGAAGQ